MRRCGCVRFISRFGCRTHHAKFRFCTRHRHNLSTSCELTPEVPPPPPCQPPPQPLASLASCAFGLSCPLLPPSSNLSRTKCAGLLPPIHHWLPLLSLLPPFYRISSRL